MLIIPNNLISFLSRSLSLFPLPFSLFLSHFLSLSSFPSSSLFPLPFSLPFFLSTSNASRPKNAYDLSEWTVRLEEGWLGEKYVFGLWFVGEGRTRSPIFYVSLYIYTVQYIV